MILLMRSMMPSAHPGCFSAARRLQSFSCIVRAGHGLAHRPTIERDVQVSFTETTPPTLTGLIP